MSKTRIFLTLSGYQLTWLGCVFGEKTFNEPLLGVYIGFLYLFLYFYFNENKIKFLKLSLLISVPGYVFDSLMVYYSVYEFNSSILIGTIPVWMIILWPSFSTLFDEILVIFKKYSLFGILLSSFVGTATYFLGEFIDVISINNYYLFFINMIIFWALLMIYYLKLILKI